MITATPKPSSSVKPSDLGQDIKSDLLKRLNKLKESLPEVKEISNDMPLSPTPPGPNPTTSLAAYTGQWTESEAKHLLRRTTFGFTKDQAEQFMDMGLDQSIEMLLQDQALSEPPLNPSYDNDPLVPIGNTWVYKGIQADNAEQIGEIISYRNQSILSWQMGKMLASKMSIREKMMLFWHNHMPVAGIDSADYLYQYTTLLEASALGNFKQLVKDMTINPSMLNYLNGNQNSNSSPNENYARELLELFTIGKGALAGPGDYTTFTEQDVEAFSRILTGWVDQRPDYRQPGEPVANFFSFRHDTTDKQLSHRFSNAIVTDAGVDEYSDAIDVIFVQEEVSKFFCRNLYRWFVYYKIDDNVEANIIEPMAAILRDSDYEVIPVLRALLSSEHFYDTCIHGAMITNPYDYIFGLLVQFNVENPINIRLRYRYWITLFFVGQISEMEYFNPPSVAGWKAYYQQPAYYQIWINSVTLAFRKLVVDAMIFTGIGEDRDEDGVVDIELVPPIDAIAFMEQTSEPSKINTLLTEFGDILHSKPLTTDQKEQLKQILIPGLPDFEWTDEYNAWKSDPNNEATRTIIMVKIQFLLRALMSMPEYYLS